MKENSKIQQRIDELRNRAELKLASAITKLKNVSNEDAMNIKKLVHELQVHQIELEMQNEELRKTQIQLELSQQKYIDLFEFAPVGYISLDKNGFILSSNLTVTKQLGWEKIYLLNTQLYKYVATDDRDLLYWHLAKVFDTNVVQTCELRLITKRGTELYVQLESVIVKENLGDSNQCRTAISDITESKLVENALRETEERYKSTIDAMGDAIHVVDENLKILLINRTFIEWNKQFDLETDVVGKNIFEIYPFLPQQTRNEYYKVFQTGKLLITSETNTICGKKLITETRKIPVINGEKVFRIITIIRDITEYKRLEEETLKTQKLESLGVLAGGIAHDFNNILVGIIGNIALVKTYIESDSEIYEFLDEAEKASSRAKNLAQQLLAFSKGGMPLVKTISIGKLIQDSAKLVTCGTNINCEFSIPDDLWPIDADEGQMGQVINNLVINAKEAVSVGGTIKIHAENIENNPFKNHPLENGRYVKIIIADNGHGISREHFPKIFDPYFTTKQDGRGLGLTTVFSIIKNHNGVITVESDDGCGTTFCIYLCASQKQPESDTVSAPKLMPGTGKILIMDDEEIVCKVASKLLKRIGYEVELANDGQEAIQAYITAKEAGKPFDVVIMDLTIQNGMGGKETITKLRKIDPLVKAIVSSGYSNDPVMANFKDYGYEGFIAKPFKMEELSQLLYSLTKRKN